MDTLQINRIMTADNYTKGIYGGTWAIDTVPTETIPVCYIVNSSPSWHMGSHWTAVYLDNGTREYFCSYGMEPPQTLIARLGGDYSHNSLQLQDITSDLCGQYCILYLMCRCRGYSLGSFINCFTNKPKINDWIVDQLL